MNHTRLTRRLQEFFDTRAKPYQRQKSALKQQFSDFLVSLSLLQYISSCTSDDVIKFLISKDSSGGLWFIVSYALRLVAIAQAFGCGDDRFFVRETFAFSVKEYLKFVLEDQASKAIVSSEAVPMLFVKFSTLINFLRHSIRRSSRLSLVNDFILVRDTVFFVFDFFLLGIVLQIWVVF